MPLFDLFKKSPKKEPARDDPFGSPEMQKKRYDAALEFIQLFQEKMPLVRGKPHAGSALAVVARLAGTSLYRSINKKEVAPGTVVLSEEVNQAWPQLLKLFAFYCKQHGIDVMDRPPVTQFPEKDEPLLDVDQTLTEYQDKFHAVMRSHGLDYLEGARAGMIACSMVFQYHYSTARDIDPHVAVGIVGRGIVEGAKTAPPLLGAAKAASAKANGDQSQQVAALIVKLAELTVKSAGDGSRLVLGEKNASIMEALGNGGKFLDLGMEGEQMLQQRKINPYLVYETALMVEMKKKIARIDLSGTSVEKIVQEWGNRPASQAPVHARLVMWLGNNAGRLGYEQNGNSWMLKR